MSNISSIIAFSMAVMLLLNLKSPLGWLTLFPKLFASSLAIIWLITGLVGAISGSISAAMISVVLGLAASVVFSVYLRLCHKTIRQFNSDVTSAFSSRTTEQPNKSSELTSTPQIIFEQDVSYWSFPDKDRQLYCDVWHQADSGHKKTALIYCHGSGWWASDKDFHTRPFFRHLAEQGYVVMDIAYRLCPEVPMFEMLGDVKRAVHWLKANVAKYGIDPDKIILTGGSAGAQLAMLAAYTVNNRDLTPAELETSDLSVAGVISCYGPPNLVATYHHTKQQELTARPSPGIGPEAQRHWRDIGRLDTPLGGTLDEVPESYRQMSPLHQVHADCPPTLLIQGNHDIVTPVSAADQLTEQLNNHGVPAINIKYPWTPHGFDLLFPHLSPATRSTYKAIDRFLERISST